MNETRERRLVRPAFRWLALAVFLLMAAMASFAGWDVVETRSFRKIVADVRAKGEPLSLDTMRSRPTTVEGLTSDRDFRAAAVLSWTQPQQNSLFDRVREAVRTDAWPAGLADEARRHIRERDDAFQLLDRGIALPFEGLSPGTPSANAGLFQLGRLAGLRTMVRAFDHDNERAIDSLYAELRLRRVIEWAWPVFRAPMGEVDRVGLVLSLTHPASTALSHAAQALSDLDRDDALKQGFLVRRVAYFETMFRGSSIVDVGLGFWDVSFSERVGRMWLERRYRRPLETLATVITAVEQPWPLRARAVSAVYDGLRPPLEDQFRVAEVAMAHRIVDDLALIRTARAAVAIEQFRRDHREALPARLDDLVPEYLKAVPVDPYTGWPLLFRTEARTYAVYSVGPNGRDDNGDFALLRFVDSWRQSRDVGTRIQYR